LLILGLLRNSKQLKTFNDNFEEMAPYCFFYEHDTAKSKQISQTIRKQYFPFDTIDIRSFGTLNNLYADGMLGYAEHKFVHLVSPFTEVFYYKFSYVGRFSLFNYPSDKPYGVQHGDDVQYPFYQNFWPLVKTTDPENFMVERMTKIYENFANTG
jgi:acetylcholinesterase